jgi:hypothetical protein
VPTKPNGASRNNRFRSGTATPQLGAAPPTYIGHHPPGNT